MQTGKAVENECLYYVSACGVGLYCFIKCRVCEI